VGREQWLKNTHSHLEGKVFCGGWSCNRLGEIGGVG